MSRPLTCADALRAGTRELASAGVPEPGLDARRLLAHALGVAPERLTLLLPEPMPLAAGAAYDAALTRRTARQPVAQITGERLFWGRAFRVTPDTLDPRPETETLVAAALGAPFRRVLDLGTGTGALLLAVLAECPEATGVGVDLAPAAAALAARNAAANGLAGRATFLCGHWAEAIAGRFDLVLSNPPYIETEAVPGLMPEVARFEPVLALDGGADGLDAYRHLVRVLPRLLAPGGRAVLEIGQGQRPAVEALALAAGLLPVAARQDLGGIDRAVVLRAA